MTQQGNSDRSSSRRTVLKGIGLTGAALVGSTASALAESAPSPRTRRLQEIQPQQYSGTATTSIEYRDAGGEVLESRTYVKPVFVVITQPIATGTQGETNPFHLEVLPKAPLIPAAEDEEGDLTLYSTYNFGGQLLQYWTLERTGGTSFTGELTDTHADQNLVWNHLQAWTPGQDITTQLAMSEGTLVEGSIENNTLTMTIRGNSIEGNTPFESRITAANASPP